MTIPDDLAAELGTVFQKLGRTAVEAMAAMAYAKDLLSLEQIRMLLGTATVYVNR